MKKSVNLFILLITILIQAKAQGEPLLLSKISGDKKSEEWVERTLSGMSLKEKVGQLFIYTIAPVDTKKNLALLRDAVNVHKAGGLLFSGGSLQKQALLTNYAQNYAEVPLMITFDGEWGLAMRLKGTPAFPKNEVLGCITDNGLIYEYGREVARECRELGVHVNFAPVADVNTNPDNPVINVRSFGELPSNVAEKVAAYSSGLQSGHVLAVAKHFPGHGDTDTDSHLALPVLPFTRERLDSVELYPFKKAVSSGIGGIMTGHLHVSALNPDHPLPSSLSKEVTEGLLQKELGFRGLVFTDALAMKGVAKYKNVCAAALRAGNDLVLTPQNLKREIQGVMEAIEKGEITEESIDNKCRKVLRYKYALGLSKKPIIQTAGLEKRISTSHVEELIKKLRLAAITVVKNDNYTLPLAPCKDVALLSIGKPQADSAFVNAFKRNGFIAHYQIDITASDSLQLATVNALLRHKKVIVSVTSRKVKPLATFFYTLSRGGSTVYTFFTPFSAMKEIVRPLSRASAVVAAHSASPEVQAQTAAVLMGKAVANGRLSVSVPGLFRAGEGVTLQPESGQCYLPEDYGMNSSVLGRIEAVVEEGIREKAFPGCQIAVFKSGVPVYNKAFGSFTYKKEHVVQPTDLYDLASLSKTTGTLLAVMKLYEQGKFSLSDHISDYLPSLKGTDKAGITIKELLFHESGLPAFLPLYKEAIDESSYEGTFFKGRRDAFHRVQVGDRLYANSVFKYKKEMVAETPVPPYTLQAAKDFYLNEAFQERVMQAIAEAPLKEKKYVYSCLNFILLKELVEKTGGMKMDVFLDRYFFRSMKLTAMTYLPLRKFPEGRIAPTVENDFLRRGRLQGYVHDETAAFLGGVSGNAGLFASARDVAVVYQMLLNGGVYNGKRYLSEETCRLFITSKSSVSRRGLGFDKPDPADKRRSPCGETAPASVFGHTGFTGTCAWADPQNNMVYVFLSNRTYPEPWNRKLMTLKIRQRIQDIIYESIEEGVSEA